MDYTLAALKLFGSTPDPSSEGSVAAQMLFGTRFQRAWLQGVVVRAYYSVGNERRWLDDGSCVAELLPQPGDAEGQPWLPGVYVMIIGAYVAIESQGTEPLIKVHKIVDLSAQPDREAMWYMEVAEAYNFFYSALGSVGC